MLRENNIEWITGQGTATVTVSQKSYINKLKKLAEDHSSVEIVAENEDGSVVAHVPSRFIKISAPRQVSEEQREAARERFMAMRKES